MHAALLYRLNLLGGFGLHSIAAPDRPIRVTTRKGRALLAYLAMAPGQRAGREQLAALFWGDRDEHHARQCLRQCLARLRSEQSPADILHAELEIVALRPHVLSIDAIEFVALAQS